MAQIVYLPPKVNELAVDNLIPKAGDWTINHLDMCADLETMCATTFCVCCTWGASIHMFGKCVVIFWLNGPDPFYFVA